MDLGYIKEFREVILKRFMCQRLWNDVKETYREYWEFVAKHKGNSVGESSRFSWITRQLKQDTKKKLESCKGETKEKRFIIK